MANQAGAVATKSIVANIKAIQVAVPMMKNMINKGQPPSPPTELSKLDLIRVVGKREPVRIYELLGKKGKIDETTKQILSIFNEGYELYKRREWNKSSDCFEKALAINPNDGPSLTHFERCITFQIHPPPDDWDGVYTMGTK